MDGMKRSVLLLWTSLGLGVFVINVYGFSLLFSRAGLPQDMQTGLPLSIDGIRIDHADYLDVILSRRSPGDVVILEYARENSKHKIVATTLVRHYSSSAYPYIFLVSGTVTLILGLIAFYLRPDEPKARMYYLASLAFSLVLVVNNGFYCTNNDWISYVPGVAFFMLYPLAPVLLLHFTRFFSNSLFRRKIWMVYLPAIILAGLFETIFLSSHVQSPAVVASRYHDILTVNSFFVGSLNLLTLIHLIFIYRKTDLEPERSQIKWIFVGLAVGLGPFIILYQFPKVLGVAPVISEELCAVFFMVVPVAFVFSVLKFRLIDIDQAINRGLVYSILTISMVGIYLFLADTLQRLLTGFFSYDGMGGPWFVALVCAVLFHPIHKKLQGFVDKVFYRRHFDLRHALFGFSKRALQFTRPDELIAFFLSRIDQAIAPEHQDVFVTCRRPQQQALFPVCNNHLTLQSVALRHPDKDRILVSKKALHLYEGLDVTQELLLDALGLTILVPLACKSIHLDGYLILGMKKSGCRHTKEELDFLKSMTGELSLNLERMALIQDIAFEKAQKDKFEELDRQKTEFISIISHELRTPMNSIMGIAELLQQNKLDSPEKSKRLIDIVVSESHRLSRFLHNVFEYNTIERFPSTYHFEEVNLRSLVEETVDLSRMACGNNGFSFIMRMPGDPVIVRADRDAIRQALINLLDNAVKYTLEDRRIIVTLFENHRQVKLGVVDRGRGISKEDKNKIFRAFYRTDLPGQRTKKGVGLGLSIVEHIMKNHHGFVEVHSRLGRGTSFMLCFPKP